ncbi:MAG: hypothetical protein LBE49_06640 [Deltaproteobacteria bacterium]|jgi:hypothetical protein|nr:hypothetical protein [Deltaproteobacteria bacterium]
MKPFVVRIHQKMAFEIIIDGSADGQAKNRQFGVAIWQLQGKQEDIAFNSDSQAINPVARPLLAVAPIAAVIAILAIGLDGYVAGLGIVSLSVGGGAREDEAQGQKRAENDFHAFTMEVI